MAVCVVTPSRQRFVAWGRACSGDARPVTADTVFEVGSLTKVFTALVLANMVRRGDMELDDLVERYLPSDYRLPVLKERQITLKDLATHTSGLPRWPPPPGTPLSPTWLDALARFSDENFKEWLATLHPPAGQPRDESITTRATPCSAWRWRTAQVSDTKNWCGYG